MFSSSHSRQPRFETLEQRQLLAGDVIVQVVNGVLTVEGDELDNQVSIAATANEGEFTITGLDGTLLHREGEPAAGELTVMGVRHARIDLGEGNNTLSLEGIDELGSVSIHTGDGGDEVNVGGGEMMTTAVNVAPGGFMNGLLGRFGSSLSIHTGGGADAVNVDPSAVGGSIHVSTGDGEDMVSLGGPDTAAAAAARVGSGLAARFGFHGGVHVALGEDNDTFDAGPLEIRAALSVHGGGGEDDISLDGLTAWSLSVWGGDENDVISVSGADVAHLAVLAGDGNDTVSVTDSVFESLAVLLGDGNDTLSISGLEAQHAALLGGDGEADTLNRTDDNEFVHELVRGFELPDGVMNTATGRMNGRLAGFVQGGFSGHVHALDLAFASLASQFFVGFGAR